MTPSDHGQSEEYPLKGRTARIQVIPNSQSIMEYTVVFAEGASKLTGNLSDKVNEMINEGWMPIGGIACYNGFRFWQAMIRE